MRNQLTCSGACLFAACLLSLILVSCGGGGGGGGGGGSGLPSVSIAPTDRTGTEGGGAIIDSAVFTIARTGSTDDPLTVNIASGGTASALLGEDYQQAPLPASVVIPAGLASVDIEINPIDDADIEGLESVVVRVQDNQGLYAIADPREVSVFIEDDDIISADIDVNAAKTMIDANVGDPTFVILDVRTPAEFQTGKIENAVNIDFTALDFEQQIGLLDRQATYLVYCQAGSRSDNTQILMAGFGYNFREVHDMTGGINAWLAAGLPTVP